MAYQLGRTELEKLAPPERILFWQNRIEFWQKEMVGPPSKMPQERLWGGGRGKIRHYYHVTPIDEDMEL